VDGVEHVDRGYERFVDTLVELGADVERSTVPEPAVP
jgi:UDP-N-acetylglucosamine enolpyruvyl transferase